MAKWLGEMDAGSSEKWNVLLLHAGSLGGNATPSAEWLKDANACLAAVGSDVFAAQFGDWVENTLLHTTGPEPNGDLIKALIWTASTLEGDRIRPKAATWWRTPTSSWSIPRAISFLTSTSRMRFTSTRTKSVS
jgi:hypothetical protein